MPTNFETSPVALSVDVPIAPGTPAHRLQTKALAVRIRFHWLGVIKALDREHLDKAAKTFGTDSEYLAGSKRIFNTSNPSYRRLTTTKSRILGYVEKNTLPYPETGVRLLPLGGLDAFLAKMSAFSRRLDDDVARLEEDYLSLREDAKEKLGELFNPEDYPNSLIDCFKVSWEFPSVDPPNYLKELHPDLYSQQCRLVAARFDEAVGLIEQAFIEELLNLVDHLVERITGKDSDGRPKVFYDVTVKKLQEFFTRFEKLNVRSNAELTELVETCKGVVGGVAPGQLRSNEAVRNEVREGLNEVLESVKGLMTEKPRRQFNKRLLNVKAPTEDQ